MENISTDWKKFENFANRAMIIIAHLNEILKIRKAELPKPITDLQEYQKIYGTHEGYLEKYFERIKPHEQMNGLYIYIRGGLYLIYDQIKGIEISLKGMLHQHDLIKDKIRIFESEVNEQSRDIMLHERAETWQKIAKYIEEVSIPEIKNEEHKFKGVKKVLEIVLKYTTKFSIFGFNTPAGEGRTLARIHLHANLYFEGSQLKSSFMIYFRKLVGVIEGMYKLANRSGNIEKDMEYIFNETYQLLSEFPEEESVKYRYESIIQNLEKVYNEM